MAKTKSAFFCSKCGHESAKWVGKCPSCNEWNTFKEEIISKPTKSSIASAEFAESYSTLTRIGERTNPEERFSLKNKELNRVLGGGLVKGSVTLVGGEPGIGKSTLMLQIAIGSSDLKVLYVSGEESENQVNMRAKRLGISNENCLLLTETNWQKIVPFLKSEQPELVIVDSIQTLHSDVIDSTAGSISQIKECAAGFLKFAKQRNVPVFLIGHITKDGNIAGPKLLEHMVDTVLQFEGDRNHIYRIVRAVKNRFGSTNELGIFEMQSKGLVEVSNPSDILISNRQGELSGLAISATMEGMRPMLIEVQALVSSAAYGTPQRSATGFDTRRFNMLLAVLEKRCGFRLAQKDVFLNITGGIRVDDPAIDLAVVCSVLSSNADIPLPTNACYAGEVGLSGEIRPVNRIEQRIKEAEKLGFQKIYLSSYNKGINQSQFQIKLDFVNKMGDIFSSLFG